MASQALTLPEQTGQAGQPTQQEPLEPNPSPRTPMLESPEDRLAKFGIGTEGKINVEEKLIQVFRLHIEDWAIPYRVALREALRGIEYDKGNQYIAWDPFMMGFFNPFSGGMAGNPEGTQQGSDDLNVYQNQCNVIQWLRRAWVSTLGADIPDLEWWPENSDSDQDNRASEVRGRVYRKISNDNKKKDVLEQCLEHLFLTGSYFRNIYWSMDKVLTGTHYEPEIGWADKVIAPDRYSCPSCGTDNPANIQNMAQGGTQCMGCGRPLTSAHFFPSSKVKMPTIVGQKEVPNGQVRWNIFNLLNVRVMPTASTQNGGVLANTPLLDLQQDITAGALRMMYPGAWKQVRPNSIDNSFPDAELARIARIRVASPAYMYGIHNTKNIPTLHKVWFQPDAICALDDQNEADEIVDLITNGGKEEGCCAAILNDKIIDIRFGSMRKEWTWCGSSKGKGAYPPAPVRTALDFQDRINDRTNSVDEFHDRAGNPPILYNKTVFGDQLNGKFLPAGSLLGVAVNLDVGRKLDDTFWQPKFSMDNGIYQWIDKLIQLVQLLVGITPQTYGGSDPNIKTKGGQEQALQVAMGILWLYWSLVREEWTSSGELSVDLFAKNATTDQYNVIKQEDSPDFENEPIRLADISGHAHAYPEANQDYPIGYDKQREIFKELFMMANGKEPNPLVMEVLDTFEARRLAMRYLGPPDMELPETPFRYKVLTDISNIVNAEQPMITLAGPPDPMTGAPGAMQVPVCQPDKDFDDLDVSIDTVVRYAIKNYKELAGRPALDALRAYLKLAMQYRMQKQVENQGGPSLLTAGVPGWGGVLGGAGKPPAPTPGTGPAPQPSATVQ